MTKRELKEAMDSGCELEFANGEYVLRLPSGFEVRMTDARDWNDCKIIPKCNSNSNLGEDYRHRNKEQGMKSYWHFCALDDQGRPVMRDGTLVEVGARYEIKGDPIMCKRGYHGSAQAIDALQYAPGPWVSKRPLEDVTTDEDKGVGRAFVQQPGIDATPVLRHFARLCALDVIHLWDAPEIVVRYLKTSDESIRDAAWAVASAAVNAAAKDAAKDAAWDAVSAAAKDAAWAAVSAAAKDAAWAAAKDAAWAAAWAAASAAVNAAAKDAAWEKQNTRLTRMLNAALKESIDIALRGTHE